MIQKKAFKLDEVEFEYWVKGSPSLLIISGTHGDECGVIPFLKKYIVQNEAKLADFLYIPLVSPSAFEKNTRENKNNNDLNRQFFETTVDSEAKAIMNFLQDKKFNLCLSFHEDPDTEKFYLYDCYKDLDSQEKALLPVIFEQIKRIPIELLHGFDDIADPNLGYFFENGYRHFAVRENNDVGFFEDWAKAKGIVQRYINPEIPGKLPNNLKAKLIDILFQLASS